MMNAVRQNLDHVHEALNTITDTDAADGILFPNMKMSVAAPLVAEVDVGEYFRAGFWQSADTRWWWKWNTVPEGAVGYWPLSRAAEELGPELYNQPNAACIGFEADATTGWVDVGTLTFESSDVQKYRGRWSMHFVADTGGDRIYTTTTVVVGKRYRASIFYYRQSGGKGRVRFGVSDNDATYSDQNADVIQTWTKLTFDLTATNTSLVLTPAEFSGANDTNLYIDALSVREIRQADESGNSDGTELYTDDNAASLVHNSNHTTGWTNDGFGTFEASAVQVHTGSWAMHFLADGNGDNAYTSISTTTDFRYRIEGWYYLAAGGDGQVEFGTAGGDATYGTAAIDVSAVWTYFSLTLTASAASLFVTIKENSGTDDTDVFIDGLSITQVRDMTGGAAYTTGVAGDADGAMQFDGVGNFGDGTNLLPYIKGDTKGTIALRVKPDDGHPAGLESLVCIADADAPIEFVEIYLSPVGVDAGKIVAQLYEAGVFQWVVQTDAPVFADGPGASTHIALTIDGVLPVLSVNGMVPAQTVSGPNHTKWFADLGNLDVVRVGCRIINGAGNTDHFAGAVEDVYYWPRDLSAGEVARLAKYDLLPGFYIPLGPATDVPTS